MPCKWAKVSEQKLRASRAEAASWVRRHVSRGSLARCFSPGEDLCSTGAESAALISQSHLSIQKLWGGWWWCLLLIPRYKEGDTPLGREKGRIKEKDDFFFLILITFLKGTKQDHCQSRTQPRKSLTLSICTQKDAKDHVLSHPLQPFPPKLLSLRTPAPSPAHPPFKVE